MIIEHQKVVGIHYTLKDNSGEVLDKSQVGNPLYFIHGMGSIILGLEEALLGKKVGDSFQVSIPPDKGYGEKKQDLIQLVDKSSFGDQDVQVGMQFTARAGDNAYNVVITEIANGKVTVDANHPLAGQILHFDVSIEDVRSATQDEISHGHVHGPGGHHH
jgi:FKBP-type peptidyl-prolyl cis-trans isomerase SlyD